MYAIPEANEKVNTLKNFIYKRNARIEYGVGFPLHHKLMKTTLDNHQYSSQPPSHQDYP